MKKLLIIILTIQMLFALEIKELKKGDIIKDNVEHLEKKYYKVGTQNGKNLVVKLTKLTKDVDLYIRMEKFDWDKKEFIPVIENLPTIRTNDCYSSNSNKENEECSFVMHGPAPGGYDVNTYILVYGFKKASYQLEVREEDRKTIDELSEKPIKGEVKKGESKQYIIRGKAGETISVSLYDLKADADLRLKIGRKANRHTFDCKSTHGGTTTDSCSVTLKQNDVVYVEVYGYKGTSYSIKREMLENKLINKAKEHCLHKDGSNHIVLCSNEKGIVYILTSETNNETMHNALYKISIAKNNESITLIREVSDVSWRAWRNPNMHEFFIKKLKNSPIYVTETVSNEADEWGGFHFFYKEKSILNFGFREKDDYLNKIYTSKNGTKLHLEYRHDIVSEKGTKCKEVYDISNPEKPKLENKECVPLYPRR